VAHNLAGQSWRPESEKNTASDIGGFYRGSRPVITGHTPSESLRRGPGHKHVARNGDSSTAVRVIRAAGEGGVRQA
jgi:hypothetical protein